MEPDERSRPDPGSGGRYLEGASGRERVSWYVYDLANQVYPFIVISFVFNPWLVEELGATDAHYTVAFAGSMLVALVMAPVVGAVTDRVGRRPVLVTTTMVAVASIALLGVGALLGLPRGSVVLVALLFFITSNLGFQFGVVAYDASLPAVAKRESLGRTGGTGIAIGYVGSLVALALMFLGLEVLGLGEPVLFVAAGATFLLFAMPALLFLRDRPMDVGPFRETVRDSFRGAWEAVRHLPRDRVLSRFLLTRFFYADAINTLILVMGVYAVTEVGFERDAVEYYVLLGLGIVFAVLFAPLWGILVDRVGPRHTLMMVLGGWSFVLLMVVVHPLLGLPQALFYVIGGLVGVFLAGTWTSDRPLLVGVAPPERVGQWFGLYALAGRFAAITGPLTWALMVEVLFVDSPGARQAGILSILLTMLLALFLLRKLPDPFVPGGSPFARFTPWGDGSGRALRRIWRLPVRAPFVLLYIAVTWFVFFVLLSPQPHPDPGTVLHVPSRQVEGLFFHLPDLVEAPHHALLAMFTAPLVNVHFVQLVYVTFLLLLFGLVFEVREGTLRIVLVFLATSVIGSLVAGLLHAAVYPGLLDHEILRQAEITVWTGGSAGAFGIMGAMAARARTWWPLLLAFVVWEINVGFWFLKSYTPAFHLSALAGGFLLMRFVIPHKAPPGTRRIHKETRPPTPSRAVAPPEETD